MKKHFCFLVTVFLLSQNVHSFTLNNSRAAAFQQSDVTINVASNCTNLGITSTELLDMTERAVNQYWNTVPTSRLHLSTGSIVDVASAFYTDSACESGTDCVPNSDLVVASGILISCNNNNDNFSSSALLGVTIPNNISGDSIIGALFLINDKADNTFQSLSYDKKISVLAHELGHAIGLGHSPVEDSLMYYRIIPDRHSLGWDDIDGVTYLYPKEQPVSGGCGTIDLQQSGENGLISMLLGALLICFALKIPKLRKIIPNS